MVQRYRLRGALLIGRDASGRWLVKDRQLKRALRLGDVDRRVAQLLARPRGATVADLGKRLSLSSAEAARRLSGLARLYLLAGERARRRVALQDEHERWRQELGTHAAQAELNWPPGVDPPRHGCVATGACCSASFLGPMTDADRVRVSGLKMGGRSRVGSGDLALESMTFRGVEHTGMARIEGRCVAQGDDQLCDIHAEHGMATKPVPCRQFPLRFHRSPRGVHVSLLLACAGYDRAREAAGDWPDRADEVRALLAEGAAAPAVAIPIELAAGVPVSAGDWWQLADELLALQTQHPGDARGWLAAVLERFEQRLVEVQGALAEGPEIAWQPATTGLVDALRKPDALPFESDAVQGHRQELLERAEALTQSSPADARRLRLLADAFEALLAGRALAPRGAMAASDDARRHLVDVVANDLPLQVALGHVDAGLASLARRVLLADALSVHAARAEEHAEVQSSHTTAALACVSRSEPDVVSLGQRPQGA